MQTTSRVAIPLRQANGFSTCEMLRYLVCLNGVVTGSAGLQVAQCAAKGGPPDARLLEQVEREHPGALPGEFGPVTLILVL